MKVHLRQRKQTGKGKISLYLEIYKGHTIKSDGKTKILRDYKYLDLYLIDKPTTKEQKQQNKEILKLANAVKAKTELEIKNNQYGFVSGSKSSVNFIEYIDKQATNSRANERTWLSVKQHLISFAGETISFKQIDNKFCKDFVEYLSNTKTKIKNAKTKATQERKLSKLSQITYIDTFNACLNLAVDDKIILSNPCKGVKKPKAEQKAKEYLTIDELKELVKTKCIDDTLKRAFLFSCLTGLRWSDIEKLKWSEVVKNTNGYRLVFEQKKTGGLEYLDISEQARTLLGSSSLPENRVFNDLMQYSTFMTTILKSWLLQAGITKKITFHCARHTFAVLQLDNGTDIYTVSKLLGHTSLKTTEVYAKIIDSKKQAAANRLPDIGLNY